MENTGGCIYLFRNSEPNFNPGHSPILKSSMPFSFTTSVSPGKSNSRRPSVASSIAKLGLANNPLLPKLGNNGSSNSVVTMAHLPSRAFVIPLAVTISSSHSSKTRRATPILTTMLWMLQSESEAPVLTEVKQKPLHIMTTEFYLNTALHGTHAMVCSDLEWFGPFLPHISIFTVLEFFGMSKTWLDFYKTFLATPLRFIGESESRIRNRGTPISYSLSVVCGEAIIFIMDFAVNQRAKGAFLYRMHDDLWLWDADVSKVASGWEEMKTYADLVGLTFNQKKTGSACVGTPSEASAALPKGDIRWGFLKFDATESRFLLEQADVDLYITETRRQLASTKSVFGWVNAYNKYMSFFIRNFGGLPAYCFSKAHIVSLIDTLARIQRELFPDGGGAVSYLMKTLKDRFDVADLPEGYFYFSII